MTVIHVGSKNQTKIQATKNVFATSRIFADTTITGIDVETEEFGHPKTITEIIRGAKERARLAFEGSDLAVGLESGLLEAPGADTGYLEATVCALCDGYRYSIGMSPSYEWPKEVLKLILDGRDGSQAFREAGFTDHEKIGTAEGAIYTLTNGAINRTKLNELAIQMALVQIQNLEYY